MVKYTNTIKVVLLETGDEMTINDSDFDPVRHEMASGTLEIPTAVETYNKKVIAGKAKKPLVSTTPKAKAAGAGNADKGKTDKAKDNGTSSENKVDKVKPRTRARLTIKK